MRIPEDKIHRHPDVRVPNNQCSHYRSLCAQCGERFRDENGSAEETCRACGAERTRCSRSRHKSSGDSCWAHSKNAPWNVFSVVAGRMGDVAFEDVLARDDRSIAQEVALARTAIMTLASLDDDQKPGPIEMLTAIKVFGEIALLRKRIEDGENLNVKVTDEVVGEIRRTSQTFVTAFARALDELVPDEDLRLRVLARTRELVTAAGQDPLRNVDSVADMLPVVRKALEAVKSRTDD